MKNIDFLPERYYERDLKRKAAIWQFAMLLGFGGLMLASTIGQIVMKRAVQTSLSELTESRIEANLKRQRVALLKQQLGSSEEVAELVTYLRHPWPRTQLLAKITESLPESIVLEGVEILALASNGPRFASTESNAAASGTTPAVADLAQLRGAHDAAQLVVRIRGSVAETEALNEYVRQLGNVPLFRNVSLSSLQSQPSQDAEPRSSFELNVKVRPGHGQAGGPDEPLAGRDTIAQYPIGRQPQ